MIVRDRGDRLQLITQPSHALLAARIMERCVPLAGSPRRQTILHAIAEHDNGWAEEDAAPMVDAHTGGVLDFIKAPAAVRQRVWPRGIERLAASPWAAALVAQHALTVYGRFETDPAWDSFFKDIRARRDAKLAASGGTLDDLVSDYAYVRLADLISLTFCLEWTDGQQYGPWTVHARGSRVVVAPDPFDGQRVPIETGALEIPNRAFRSAADLADEIQRATSVTLLGVAGSE